MLELNPAYKWLKYYKLMFPFFEYSGCFIIPVETADGNPALREQMFRFLAENGTKSGTMNRDGIMFNWALEIIPYINENGEVETNKYSYCIREVESFC